VHLLVEKPLSSGLRGIDGLIRICRENALCLMTGYNLRFSLTLQKFRASIDEGRVGRILSVRAEVGQYLPSWRPGTDYRESPSAQSRLGGGVLLELSHEMDYLLWLFGPVKGLTAIVRRQGDLEVDVEDTVHMILEFPAREGARGIVGALSMDFIRRDRMRRCTAIGSHGTLCWDGIAETVSHFDPEAGTWRRICVHPGDMNESYRREIRHFVECVRTGKEAAVTGEQGKAVLEVVAAARQSASTSRTVLLGQREGGDWQTMSH